MWQRQVTSLRPLGVGERIDVAIKIVRKNFLTFAKAALAIAIPSAVVVVLIVLTLASSVRAEFSTTTSSTGVITTPGSGSFATILGGLLSLEIFLLLVITLITAVEVRIVGNAYLGQPTSWRDGVAFGLKRLHSVIWIQFLIGVALAAVDFVGTFGLGAAASSLHAGVVGVLITVVLGIALFVGLLWFAIGSSLATPTLMLEGVRGTKAIRRSLSLCRGHWWTTFGTLLLAYVLTYIAFIVVFVVSLFVSRLLGSNAVVLAIEFGVLALLAFVVTSSFFASVLVVITIDLRVRKEGFDIEHLAAQMGTTSTSAALSFMPAIPAAPGWGYGNGPPGWGNGAPGGPAGPGYGGWTPPPPGWQPVGQPSQQQWGQQQQQLQPWGPPPQQWGPPPPGWPQPPAGSPGWQQPPTGSPGWPQPSPAPPQPLGTPQGGRLPPGPPAGSPQTSAEGVPFRPLPPFRPRTAEPGDVPPATQPPAPPSPHETPSDPEQDS
jgi:hypothetical protein